MRNMYLKWAILFVICSSWYMGWAQTISGTLMVDCMKQGAAISKSMYGIFFEEINHAGDGGLYAELVQNRGFEEHTLISGCEYRDGFAYAPRALNYISGKYSNWKHPWDINKLKFTAWKLDNSFAKTSWDVVEEKPLHPATPHSMRIDIEEVEAGHTVNLINEGYWGIPVRKGKSYNLRFYMRSDEEYVGSMKVRIVSAENKVLAEKNFDIDNSGEWKEYKAILKASDTASKSTLQLCFDAPGTVWIDYVSLFPCETFKGRENGLRKDVAQKLADLKPAFIRWPGGCIVEGATLENRVKWKETLGDLMTRRGEWVLWNYRTTMGLGYHEFLQFCEDIGADAMFVANVGLSCRFRNGDFVDESQFPVYIQDICDAIDYAIGDASTVWGKRRIQAGHENPFPLKYIELGNENWGSRYVDIYNRFYAVLKERYPQITFISTIGFGDDEKRIEKTDMIDPHWYVTSQFFWDNTHLFDAKERGKYDVYVGEFACNQKVGSGNMAAALSEAAFMLGMERNSDLVKMVSYAPLLENSNRRNWSTNLIWINNEQAIGRSSYYVQYMFSNNRPDINWDSKLTVIPTTAKKVKLEAIAGYSYQNSETIIKVVNGEAVDITLDICLNADEIQSRGKVIELSAVSELWENSHENPNLILPKKKEFRNFSEKFQYTFKPYSFTILRIKNSL